MEQISTQQRVTEDYFRTTSAVSVRYGFSPASLDGARRRLGPWLDVADKDVLDLGSGLGTTCKLCVDAGARSVTGVNLSQDEIDFSSTHVNAHFVRKDIEAFLKEVTDCTFDRIFALNILEHLDKGKLGRVLDHAARVLRPGGTLTAMVPNATSTFGSMTRYWDITHENAFTPSSVRQLARLCGFSEDVRFRECGPVFHGVVSGIRCMLWRSIRMATKIRLLIETGSTKEGVYTADMMMRLTKRTINDDAS